MKTQWFKKAVAMCLSLFMVLSLAACSGGSTDSQSETSSEAGSEGTSSEASSGEKLVVSLATTNDPTGDDMNQRKYANFWMPIIEEYEATYPDREVEYTSYIWETIDAKLMSDYAAGIERGVSLINSSQLATLYKNGALASLQPIWDGWTDEQRANYEWQDLSPYQNDGQFYVLPMQIDERIFCYRKDLFEEAGLDPEKPPKTVDELVEYAKLLTKDDVYGLGIYLGNEEGTAEVSYNPLIWYYGGDTWDVETKEATFASDAGVQAAQFLSDCVNTWKITPEFSLSGRREDVVQTPFINNQYAMITGCGSYWLPNFEAAGMISGIAPPTEDQDMGNLGFFHIDGWNWYTNSWDVGICANCTYQEEAMDLIRIILDPEHLKHIEDSLPANLAVYDEPQYKNSPTYDEYKYAIETGKFAVPTANYKNLTLSISAAVQEVITTNDASKTAEIMKRYQDEYNAQYAGE